MLKSIVLSIALCVLSVSAVPLQDDYPSQADLDCGPKTAESACVYLRDLRKTYTNLEIPWVCGPPLYAHSTYNVHPVVFYNPKADHKQTRYRNMCVAATDLKKKLSGPVA